MIVVVAGLPLTGKTFFAKALTKKLKAVHLNSDLIRKKLIKKPAYSRREKLFVYNELFKLIELNLRKKKNVVVDATFYKKSLRLKAKNIARKFNSNFYLIELKAKNSTIKSFALLRSKKKTESDADLNVYFRLKKEFQPIKEKHLIIQSELPLKEQLTKALNFVSMPFIESLRHSFNEKTELIETHISWLLLTKKFVYKIKKPVKFSFLDFSSLKKRRYYCFKELKLNSRFSKGIYLKVLPVKKLNERIFIAENSKKKAKTIDFALKLKKLPEKNKMDLMLEKNKVKKLQIKSLAKTIALFHLNAKKVKRKPFGEPSLLRKQINDLNSVKGIVLESLGKAYSEKIDFILTKANAFLKENNKLLIKRKQQGFVRDCHGDLHSGNVFLMRKPVLFDCIEFNESFRLIDTASDIAFMAMDLDSFNKKEFSSLLIHEYLNYFKEKHLEFLLPFFKSYRANVRAKVNAFQLLSAKTFKEKQEKKNEIKKYLKLAESYSRLF